MNAHLKLRSPVSIVCFDQAVPFLMIYFRNSRIVARFLRQSNIAPAAIRMPIRLNESYVIRVSFEVHSPSSG